MITENLSQIRQDLPEHVKLVCVSKFHSINEIMEAYTAGERIFGESKVQELASKQEQLPADIEWHFIGHLQSNKVKYIVPFVLLIHGVDSLKLLQEIDKQAQKASRKVNCLLQVHIALEETKFGFSEEELLQVVKSGVLGELKHIIICGLMGMATFTDNTEQVRAEFSSLKSLFDRIKEQNSETLPDFNILSMGMSDDYSIAVEEGSTMVRIGSKIFGQRVYT